MVEMTEKPRNIEATGINKKRLKRASTRKHTTQERKTKGNAMTERMGRRRRLKRKTRDRTSFPFAEKSRETRIRQIEVCAPRSVRGRGSSEGDRRLAEQNEGPRETRLCGMK